MDKKQGISKLKGNHKFLAFAQSFNNSPTVSFSVVVSFNILDIHISEIWFFKIKGGVLVEIIFLVRFFFFFFFFFPHAPKMAL